MNDKIIGRNPVIEALRAGRQIDKILIAKGTEGSISVIKTLAHQNKIITLEVDRKKLDTISQSSSHQGVIALAAVQNYASVDDILKAAHKKAQPPFVVILDEITDPHNIGSIIRTANAAGAHGVIIPKRNSAGLSATVAKTSAGAIEYTPVARVSNIAQTIEYLKSKNIWIYGTHQDAETSYADADLTGAIGLVIGSEGHGIGSLISQKCDFLVSISMAGEINSLGASVAAGILMFEAVRQKSRKL
ncbi:MAG: 23S rRNA (guanosine(2251)-2'-O)-methyltransferase RlmB [Firmicutes bacterium]|nr:23S rRNA (guanosine(2251)-2'-O)-methyltransferase RlmB [Bacillota bacterium]